MRRVVVGVVFVLVLVSLGFGSVEAVIMGDIDGDDTLTVQDAILSLKMINGMPYPSIDIRADVSGNGKIDLEETIYILQAAAGIRAYSTLAEAQAVIDAAQAAADAAQAAVDAATDEADAAAAQEDLVDAQAALEAAEDYWVAIGTECSAPYPPDDGAAGADVGPEDVLGVPVPETLTDEDLCVAEGGVWCTFHNACGGCQDSCRVLSRSFFYNFVF